MAIATVPAVGPDASIDDVVAGLDEAGAVIVENLVEPEVMDAVHDELRPFIEATPPGPDDFSGHNTRRTGSLIARSPAFRPLAVHPVVLGTLDRVLGDHATTYQLHLTQVIDIAPGEPGQMVHRDQWAFDFFSFPAGFEVECHTMWAMTDFTEENGATRIIPGSHKWADKLRPTYDETVPAPMPKGSVLLYIGSVYHGGGANRSDEHRVGINVGYTLSWLRQEENQYLACPPEVARTLPTDLAKLIGYQRGAYALGYFGDTQDPMEALHGPKARGFDPEPEVRGRT
jgi:ectoine hydroxylase-related dioxygenase (phytanoyl-CoA dioxygenase family)